MTMRRLPNLSSGLFGLLLNGRQPFSDTVRHGLAFRRSAKSSRTFRLRLTSVSVMNVRRPAKREGVARHGRITQPLSTSPKRCQAARLNAGEDTMRSDREGSSRRATTRGTLPCWWWADDSRRYAEVILSLTKPAATGMYE